MKTAEEWLHSFGEVEEDDEYTTANFTVDDIKQIQLDAWKQGMNDAANIVNKLEPSGTLGISNAILSAIEKGPQC